MGIEKIRSCDEINFTPRIQQSRITKNRAFLSEVKDSTSFTGAAAVSSAAVNTTKSLKDILLEIMPKSAKNMVKMHEGMGEIQNQLINAIGTGLIAPLFIKFNPLSDTDENTRTYTAWRQPVSAVLAVGTQCAIVKPFNNIIRWMSDIGYLGPKYNSSLFPSEHYISKLIKEENPNIKYTPDELKNEIDSRKNKYAKQLKEMIENDKIVFKKTDTHGISQVEMPDKDFKQLFENTIDSIIKAEERQRLNAIETKLPRQIERNLFYHNHPVEAKAVLQRISSKLTQSYSQHDIEPDKTTAIYNNLNKEFKTILAELKNDTKNNPSRKDINDELSKIVTELKNKNTDKDASAIRILDKKINSLIENINLMASKKTTKDIIDHVNKDIFTRTNAIDAVISTLTEIRGRLEKNGITVKEAQKIIDERINASDSSIISILKAKGLTDKEIRISSEYTESIGVRLKQKAGSIASCIADQMKEQAKANIDGYKRWTGLGVSLAILPVTCWLLNKIYPWFMDLAFPSLSNKQGKNNDKKAEVK